MVDQARSAGIKPVLCTIHPIGEEPLLKRHKKESYGTEGPNGKIDRFNKALAECFYGVVADEIKLDSTIVCLGDSVTWGARVKGAGTTTGETYPAYLNQISGDDIKK